MKSVHFAWLLIVSTLFFAGCSNETQDQPRTIHGLMLHFQQCGLKFIPPLESSNFEKEFHNDNLKLSEALKPRKSKLREFRNLSIQNIHVKIRRYATDKDAVSALRSLLELEKNIEERALKENKYYYKQDFYLNPPYILSIKHFKVFVENDKLRTIPLKLPQKSLTKIIKAFNSYD